jgi:hypothetical protein
MEYAVIFNYSKMRSHGIRVGPKSRDSGVLTRRPHKEVGETQKKDM